MIPARRRGSVLQASSRSRRPGASHYYHGRTGEGLNGLRPGSVYEIHPNGDGAFRRALPRRDCQAQSPARMSRIEPLARSAGDQGIEPRLGGPEPPVLPLNQSPMVRCQTCCLCTVICCLHLLVGPEGIEPSNLPLKRRLLYLVELRSHVLWPRWAWGDSNPRQTD